MDFYRGNKLLTKLNAHSNFICPPNGVWNLLYANEKHYPVVNLRVYESNDLFNANKNKFPIFQSVPTSELIIEGEDSFKVKWFDSKIFNLFNGESLYEEYLQRNLILRGTYEGKPFNSKASSFYHIWQSKKRFKGGVTDIDLLRLGDKGDLIELIEIKRSKISINSWNPYYNDRGGYEILDNFCRSEGLEFTIVYYLFSTKDSIEDISKIVVMKKQKGFSFTRRGTYDLNDFISHSYLI